MQQLFIIEGRLLGQATRQKYFHLGELQAPYSYIWYCEHCSDVFARTPVILDDGKTLARCIANRGCCRKCADKQSYPCMWQIPGSIWTSWDKHYTSAFPDAVLEWEFLRHLDQTERLMT